MGRWGMRPVLILTTAVCAVALSTIALASLPLWEKQFSTRIDNSTACRSYELPLPDSSQDVLFCFAAAIGAKKHAPPHRDATHDRYHRPR